MAHPPPYLEKKKTIYKLIGFFKSKYGGECKNLLEILETLDLTLPEPSLTSNQYLSVDSFQTEVAPALVGD